MNSVSQDDLDFCWDEVLRSDAWFRLHFTFAPRSMAPQILALYALYSMLEKVTAMSDESLGLAQLAWWQAELSPKGADVSAHPVIRALRQSGALRSLPTFLRESLVAEAMEISQKPTINTRSELKSLCNRFGEARVMSELALGSEGQALDDLRGHCAGTGLSSLVALALRSGAGLWFTPLELQARFQCGQHAIEYPTPEGEAVMDTLGQWSEDWFRDQVASLRQVMAARSASHRRVQHLPAAISSQRLQLGRTIRNIQKGAKTVPGRWRVRDFVRVWHDCRRWSKPREEA